MEAIELLKNIKDLINKNPYYRYLTKQDREDVTQETFMRVWEKIKNKEIADDWETIKGYVFISGRNNSAKIFRHTNRMTDIEPFEYALEGEEEEYTEYDTQEKINKVLSVLHRPEDINLIKKRFEGYSLDEIADEMGYTKNQISYLNGRLINALQSEFQVKVDHNRKNYYILIDVETDEEVARYINYTKLGLRFGYSSNKIKRILKRNLLIEGKYKVKKVDRI